MTGAANATKCGLGEWRIWCSEQRKEKGEEEFRKWFNIYEDIYQVRKLSNIIEENARWNVAQNAAEEEVLNNDSTA